MKWIVGVFLIALFLVSASMPSNAAENNNEANVRVIHASPDAPSVDIYVDGKAALKGVSYKDVTAYVALSPGEKKVQVFASSANGKGKPVLEQKLTVETGKDYSVVALGKLENLSLLVIEEQKGSGDKASLRAVHASPDAPPVDIVVKEGDVLLKNLAFTQASHYQNLDPGSYNLQVRATGSDQAVLDLPNFPIEPGVHYTAIVIGFVEGEPSLNVILLKDGKS